jgi:hypothetical protein
MSYYATFIRYSKARYFFVDKPTGSPVEEENIEKIATVKIGELTDEELSLFKSNIVKYKTGPIIELPITSEGLIVCTEFDFCVDSLDEISQLNFSVGVWYFGIYLREVKDDSPLAERVAIRLEIIEPDNEKLPPHLAVCLDIANKIRSERTKPASAAESETTAPAADKPKTVPAGGKNKPQYKCRANAAVTDYFVKNIDKCKDGTLPTAETIAKICNCSVKTVHRNTMFKAYYKKLPRKGTAKRKPKGSEVNAGKH